MPTIARYSSHARNGRSILAGRRITLPDKPRSSARYPFKLRRLALKAHPDNRAHAAKWLQSVAHLGPRWIIGQALARTELARGVA
jgi:hypothetical protein